MSEVTQTLTLRGPDAESIDCAMADALIKRGYQVIAPRPDFDAATAAEWETPGELAVRLGIHIGSLSRSMARPECPKPYSARRGPTYRLLALISTDALDAYLVRHKKENP